MSVRLFTTACAVGLFVLGGVAWAQEPQQMPVQRPTTQPQGQQAQGQAQQQQGQQGAPAGDAAKGKQLVMSDGCYECHGTVGEGGRATGPRIARTQLPYDAFLQQLRVPANEMPPYEPAILSDADAANIYAYLQSLPAPQAAKDIPLLNQ